MSLCHYRQQQEIRASAVWSSCGRTCQVWVATNVFVLCLGVCCLGCHKTCVIKILPCEGSPEGWPLIACNQKSMLLLIGLVISRKLNQSADGWWMLDGGDDPFLCLGKVLPLWHGWLQLHIADQEGEVVIFDILPRKFDLVSFGQCLQHFWFYRQMDQKTGKRSHPCQSGKPSPEQGKGVNLPHVSNKCNRNLYSSLED